MDQVCGTTIPHDKRLGERYPPILNQKISALSSMYLQLELPQFVFDIIHIISTT